LKCNRSAIGRRSRAIVEHPGTAAENGLTLFWKAAHAKLKTRRKIIRIVVKEISASSSARQSHGQIRPQRIVSSAKSAKFVSRKVNALPALHDKPRRRIRLQAVRAPRVAWIGGISSRHEQAADV